MTKTLTLTLPLQCPLPQAKGNVAETMTKKAFVSKATSANLIMGMTQWFLRIPIIRALDLTCQAVAVVVPTAILTYLPQQFCPPYICRPRDILLRIPEREAMKRLEHPEEVTHLISASITTV